MKGLILVFIIIITVSSSISSDNKTSAWLGTFAKKEIHHNISAWMETQIRYGFETGGTNQVLYRTGLLYKLDDKQEIGLLYGYIQSSSLKEHRFTLQHGMKFTENYSHRARFEFRDLENGVENATRFRYLLKAQYSMNKNYKFVTWNEVFLNSSETPWNGDRFFERNRFFIGTRRSFEKISIEFGYLNQYVPRASEDTIEHVGVIYIFI